MDITDLTFKRAKEHFLLALDHISKERWADAERELKTSLKLMPNRVSTRSNLCTILIKQKKYREARELIREIGVIDPENPELSLNQGLLFYEEGRHREALVSYDRAIEREPDSAEVWSNRALALDSLQLHEEALASHDRAILLKPDYVEAWSNRGNSLRALKRHAEALASHDRAIELKPDCVEAWSNRGVVLSDLQRHDEALASYDRAIELSPDYAEAWSNRGNSLRDLNRREESLASYDRAIELKPDSPDAWSNRGVALADLKLHDEALASCERAIELRPDYAKAWSNRGVVLGDLQRLDEALASCERAIELKPDYAEAWSNRGNTLHDLRRYEEALASYERSIELKPNTDYVIGNLVHTQMKICDWTDFDVRCRTLESRLLNADRASSPFPVLGLFDDPSLQRLCAELYAKRKFSFGSKLGPIGVRGKKSKIRVGYFSMDFREHPVAHLMTELIETHDRNRFEIYGFSFGLNTGDALRKRLEMAFDKFLEVKHLSALNIARLARDYEIDIAVDLGGYTQDSRTAIFAHRAAPIQINYLGFPGTMGTKHLDYFIGDRIAVSDSNLEHFSEKVIFLPNSFQVNPSSRPTGSTESSRSSYGLPERGFVFCCFNNIWKITPDVFKVWARILKGVHDSVLWLSVDSDSARRRLRSALENFDVDGNRLLFSPRVSGKIYFDQYRFVDLFLDTLPYNAGTTASDALWIGAPLVTLAGKSFAGRMAAGLLHSVGLPELITHTTEEYESLAIELANNPEKIASLKARLVENRATCPLFNTALFTQYIESAYQVAYDRYHEGLAPDHIYISP